MTILFEQIPSTLLVPGFYTETNTSRAASGNPSLPRRMIVVGQRLSTGTVATAVPYRVFSVADAEAKSGVGSQVAEMVAVAKAANRFVEMWAIGLDDNAAGVPATCTLTVTGTITKRGTLALYVAPYWVGATLRGRYLIDVEAAATVTAIAAAIVTAITADPYRCVTASSIAGVVTLTARQDGTAGNSIYVKHSYNAGEALPTGMALAITAMASGATDSVVSGAIAAMGDTHYTHLVHPFTDATNLTAIETEMTRRWGGTVQQECHAFCAASGSLSTLTTLGDGRNSELSSPFGSGLALSPPWVAAADIAAVDANEFHPMRPLKGLLLNSMVAPVQGDEFDAPERQQLLAEGISTYTVDSSGKCRIDRLVTSYQKDANGNPSSIFRDRGVAGTLFAIRYDWRTFLAGKYPRHLHAADGTAYSPGLPIVTPSTMKAEFAGRARQTWAYELGWIEDPDQFLADVQIERTEDGMDMVGVPNLINPLHIVRTRLDFIR